MAGWPTFFWSALEDYDVEGIWFQKYLRNGPIVTFLLQKIPEGVVELNTTNSFCGTTSKTVPNVTLHQLKTNNPQDIGFLAYFMQ